MTTNTFKLNAISKALIPALTVSLLAGCFDGDSTPNMGGNTGGDLPQVETGNFVALSDNEVAVYYSASDASLNNALYIFNNDSCKASAETTPDWNTPLAADGQDDNGVYWKIDVNEDISKCFNFIVRTPDGGKAIDADLVYDMTQTHAQGNYVFTQNDEARVYPELYSIPQDNARVYFNSDVDDAYTLHQWNGSCTSLANGDSAWPGQVVTGASETYGTYWDVPLAAADCFNFIPNNSGNGYQTNDLQFDFSEILAGNAVFIFKGENQGEEFVTYEPLANLPTKMEVTISGASAHWISESRIAIPSELNATRIELYTAENASMTINNEVVENQSNLIWSDDGVPAAALGDNAHYQHLSAFSVFEMKLESLKAKDLLKHQLYVKAFNGNDVVAITQVQIPQVLDSLYTAADNDADEYMAYGADTSGNAALWAPTAKSVELVPYSVDKVASAKVAMTLDPATGIWSTANSGLTHGDFYRYAVEVYHPATDSMQSYEVTDPYSLSLSMNSKYSQVVDMSSADVTPAGWMNLTQPHAQANPAEFVLYESHIRDLTAADDSVEAADRGKYTAFADHDATSMMHLKKLSDEGVTHLHLMPTFDIATINEDPTKIVDLNSPVSQLCEVNDGFNADTAATFGTTCGNETIGDVLASLAESDNKDAAKVQEFNAYIRMHDGFNWGYDPYHYTVPEGSYSTDAEGLTRIKEFREMVMNIKDNLNMNVVMDVVYNHTNEAGVSDKSVLDKLVPGYYQRLNELSGGVETSTCCSNTAPENAMMAKLIKDSLVTWTTEYKIDGYRFDLMGHHPKAQMVDALAAVNVAQETVEAGTETYFYGEGWNYGEVGNDRRFIQATQLNMFGTGIGTFSDRLRDVIRGGGPFDGGDWLRYNQGFGNGAVVKGNDFQGKDFGNGAQQQSAEDARKMADLVRLGMAGNLREFKMIDQTGATKLGKDVDYNGQPAGYAQDASEIQNYVSKHDNQTLWDNNSYKIDYAVSVEDRVRMQGVSVATVMLGQAVPFVHSGVEVLRSKSMQRDSYDSGDWYNKLQFDADNNNFDVGLPRADKDGSNFDIIDTVITGHDANAKPTTAEINMMKSFFNELAALRNSSALFSLNEGTKIMNAVDFHNTGADQTLGLIVMSIDGSANSMNQDSLLVVINASQNEQNVTAPTAGSYTLHVEHEATGSITNGSTATGNALTIKPWSVSVFATADSIPVIAK